MQRMSQIEERVHEEQVIAFVGPYSAHRGHYRRADAQSHRFAGNLQVTDRNARF
jgi:hypothetical protein